METRGCWQLSLLPCGKILTPHGDNTLVEGGGNQQVLMILFELLDPVLPESAFPLDLSVM